MRIYLAVIILLLVSEFNLSAQNSQNLASRNEIGININSLAANFLSFEDISNDISSLENLVFFKTGKNNYKFRTAINYDISNSIEGNGKVQDSFGLLKLGFERRHRLTKSWVFHSGFELFGLRSNSEVTSTDFFFEEFKSTTQITRLGTSFIYGIQISFSDHLAIGTEGYFFLSFASNKVIQESRNISNESTDERTEIGITLPRSLLLSYYF